MGVCLCLDYYGRCRGYGKCSCCFETLGEGENGTFCDGEVCERWPDGGDLCVCWCRVELYGGE